MFLPGQPGRSQVAVEEEIVTDRMNTQSWASAPTRRQMIASGAVALAGLAVGSARAQAQQAMPETKTADADKTRTSLHQEIDFKATPHRIYEILLDSKQFAAFTSMPAEISREAGGAFVMFGDIIVGRNIELVPDQRIVQAWRPKYWDPGDYSIVEFRFKEQASGTKLILDHRAFPAGDFSHLDPGWYIQYWKPLAKYLG